jgi:hypothetical protein
MGEITAFIRSNKITDRWKPNDTISICDGSWCELIIWQTTVWNPFGPPYADPRSSYKNSLTSSVGGNTPSGYTGGGYQVSLTGHWEWWDYYSNGTYIGSSEAQYMIDSVNMVLQRGLGSKLTRK